MLKKRLWKEEYDNLLKEALEVRKKAYTPYSKFKVGAAILTDEGEIISGCNVENAAYPVGICAERNAFSHAISLGIKKFKAILIVGGKGDKKPTNFCFPCGMCRQFMREFCDDEFLIIFVKYNRTNKTDYKIYTLIELLPESFTSKDLNK